MLKQITNLLKVSKGKIKITLTEEDVITLKYEISLEALKHHEENFKKLYKDLSVEEIMSMDNNVKNVPASESTKTAHIYYDKQNGNGEFFTLTVNI